MALSSTQSLSDRLSGDSLYQQVMCSPHLSDHLHTLCQRFLSPDELSVELEYLVESAECREDIEVERESLGVTASGRELVGWSVRRRDREMRPIILSASQHHGPENIGASVALYVSHLLLDDEAFTPLLDQFQFTFFPQQNPDALEYRGNLTWMRDPHDLTQVIQHYQYDPRCVDVEHGVPHERLAHSG